MLTPLTGALAGFVHVLAGPDHLAAVAPLAIAGRRRGWHAGFTWGLGHTSGVVVVATVAVLLRDVLPPIEIVSAWSERLVGGALIGVGIWALRRGLRIEASPHAHRDAAHDHLHVRRGPAWTRRIGHGHASFLMGALHGLAGSSHVLGVLPALALPTRGAALTYVAAFAVGTVAAMTSFGAVVGRAPGAGTHRALMLAASALAFLIGGVWLIM